MVRPALVAGRREPAHGLQPAVLAIVVIAVVAWFKSGPPPLAEKTALVLDLQGRIAEQKSGNLRQSALNELRGNDTSRKVQLRDVRDVLAAAAADPKIERVVLVLDDLDNAGIATLHEIAAAVDRFKAAGKQVVAWGSSYDQRQYYIAAHADEVLLHPLGMVYLEGYGALPQLLQGRARPARHQRQPEAGRHLQERGRAVHRERAVAGIARGRRVAVRRAVVRLHRRGREGAQAAGRQHRARHRRTAAALCRGRRRRREAGAEREAGRRPEDPRRAARAARRARREGRRAQDVPPGLVRRIPRAPEAEGDRRCGRRGRRRGRDRRRPRAARRRRRAVDVGADPQGARRRPHQGDRAARQFAGRQRLRLGAGAARARGRRAPPASRSSSRWATSPRRAATGSRPRPTR